MFDGLGGRASNADGNFFRIAQAPGRETLDLLGNGGRKEKRLTFLRTFLDNASDIGKESHVEHPVYLVEDKHLEIVETNLTLLHEIKQSARRGDDDVSPFLQGLALCTVTNAAEDDDGVQVCEGTEFLESGLDLKSQFAGRFQDQAADFSIRILELTEDRQAECGCLARTRLRGGDQVASLQSDRYRLRLNRRRLHIAHSLCAVNHGLI